MDTYNADRIIIDGSRISSREEFFAEIRAQIGGDLLIGSNLDALHDALTSLTTCTVIEILGEAELSAALGDYWKRILWLLNDCMDENRNLKLEILKKQQ